MDDEAFANLRRRVFASFELERLLVVMRSPLARRRHVAGAFQGMDADALFDVVELMLEYDRRLA